MTSAENTQNQPLDPDPRSKLKRVARQLMAERGIHSVTVREIAEAAGQKNKGAVAYYFGTKGTLISEILIDGAQRIESRRAEHLCKLEADGGPMTVTEAVAAIVIPSAEFADEDQEYGQHFNRFLAQLSFSDNDFIDETLAGDWNSGYQRCLTHLRKLTANLTRTEQSRRFIFLGAYVSSLLSQREVLLADKNQSHPSWRSKATLHDIVRTAAAIVEAPAENSNQDTI